MIYGDLGALAGTVFRTLMFFRQSTAGSGTIF